ncbi:hypothetical protein N1851_015288 [Merluccius polli]|uniref:Uncharacterized protein n=1 Tax=Merluccius polli TaxID=89951 RepID=A0AA47P0G4_MERPO|nr:hypothetical protein N1851_015288 [Merluccius polli]
MRERWKQYQRQYREKKRVLIDVLNLTPPSMNTSGDEQHVGPPEPIVNLHDHDYVQPNVEVPQASSTPFKAVQKRSRQQRAALKDREKLRSELRRIKRELKTANSKTKRLEKKLDNQKKGKKDQEVIERNKQRDRKKSSGEKKEQVVSFLCRDENTRMLSGKKDTVTKNKIKLQRRVLLHSLKDIHASYNGTVLRHHRLSYRQFVRYCPFYITPTKNSDRNTCACIDHENVKLIVDKLYQRGILQTRSISDLLAGIACDTSSKQCMYRVCVKCCYQEVAFEGPLDEEILTWQQWSRITKTEEGKTYTNFAKVTQSGKTADLLALLNKKLDSLAKHQFNWIHQVKALREKKETLKDDEICIHVDFSENYSCKLNTEIQSFHFGGSRKQATIHTCVVYTASTSYSYATISASLRHDERAVWAHLEPVLKDAILKCKSPPSSLHVISDGPVNQYRNRKNFYLLSTVPFLYGFKNVSWNFSEKAHGKGAPDGVGGAVKRLADAAVLRGRDLQTAEHVFNFLKDESTVRCYWISEEEINKYDEKVPLLVPAIKGTLKIHQVTCQEPAVIQYRDISCFCKRPNICKCHGPSAVDFRDPPATTSTSDSMEDQESKQGKFAIVRYEGKPFVGQIIQVVGDEVGCMQQLARKNVFTWPHPPDNLFYYESDVLHIISEPEPMNSRHSKLIEDAWKQFQAHSLKG